MLALYQADVLPKDFLDDARRWIQFTGKDQELLAFALKLFDSTVLHLDEVDPLIEQAAQNWQLKRMAAVDRAILRLAVCELMFHRDIPPKVVINEAVELAKRYSTGASGSFVNGILDKIHRDEAARRKEESRQ